MTVDEKHVPIIASALSRVRDVYVNIMCLPCGTIEASNGDPIVGSPSVHAPTESNQNQVISPRSSESMLLCLLTTFKEHQLIALCVDGQFFEKVKTNPEQ